jgi:hypothetical protein
MGRPVQRVGAVVVKHKGIAVSLNGKVMGRPWHIVSVKFDDGTTVRCTEDQLRRYLETHDVADLGFVMNRASKQLQTAIRRMAKSAPRIEAARRTSVRDGEITMQRVRRALSELPPDTPPSKRAAAISVKLGGSPGPRQVSNILKKLETETPE